MTGARHRRATPRSRWFAVADVGIRIVQVWDTVTGERCGITGPLGMMRWIAFSPDGTRLVSVGGSENQLTFAVHALPDGTDVVPAATGGTAGMTLVSAVSVGC